MGWGSFASAVKNRAKSIGGSVMNGMKSVGTGIVNGGKAVANVGIQGAKAVGGFVKDNAGVIGQFAKEHAGEIGSFIGGAAGAALAPFTGGSSVAIGTMLGSMGGKFIQGGGLENTKIGRSLTGLTKSVVARDSHWKEHAGDLAINATRKLTSRVAKHYVGDDNVRAVKSALQGGPIGKRHGRRRAIAGPAPQKMITYQPAQSPTVQSGGPASNVYGGGTAHGPPVMMAPPTLKSRVHVW
jgi:hypothetical protein